MKVSIQHGPGCSAAKVTLGSKEVCITEGGAMIAMSGDMGIETTTQQKASSGGIWKAIKRVFTGESFFINHFTAGPSGGELWLSTALPGDMITVELQSQTLIVQGGSFVACEPGVTIDLGWQGFKNLFSGENLFWIHMKGNGKAILNSFGAIYPIEVNGEYIIDTGHIVAFEETLNYTVTKAGRGWISSFLSGEGLVCRFNGTGTVWCQSHNPGSFGQELGPLLPARRA